MKLIATQNFRNVQSLRLKDDDGKSTLDNALHADHIHKGAVFSIGDDKLKLNAADLMKLNKSDASAAYNVSLLLHAGVIADATDEKAVKAVKDSIAEDERRENNAKKLDQSVNAQSVVAQLITAIRGMKAT